VTGLLALLQEFFEDKRTMLVRHQAGARFIGQYDVNNTYQYVINREETELTWVADAIASLGGTLSPPSPQESGEPDRGSTATGPDRARRILAEDAQDAQAFVTRWQPRVGAIENARHARMLGLIIGEVLEQKRFFEQALAGRTDLLGRRAESLGPAHGEVLPSRWIE
jgi:hypothetical protein